MKLPEYLLLKVIRVEGDSGVLLSVMEKDSTCFEELIAKYFSGEANPAEISELSAWATENPENELLFRDSRQAWTALESVRVDEKIDVGKALEENIEYRMSNIEYRIKKSERGIPSDSLKKENISPFHHFAISLFDKHPVSRTLHLSSFILRAAAVIILLAIPSFLLYRYLSQPAMQELAASTGRMESTLPDGSRVTLNTGAVIRYPEQFKGRKRAVSLDGEAYFDVAHNAFKPFIISTDGIRVEVKGTSFYINTRSMSGDFELVLTTGKVELYFENRQGKSMTMNPGEKAVIHGNRIIITPNQDANYMAWKTHRITFNNDPLNTVAATLTRVYEADIRLADPALAQCRLTATFDNQSLESVLNVLSATLDVDIRNSGSLMEISGKGCR